MVKLEYWDRARTKLKSREHFVDGKLSRSPKAGPARETWYESGQQEWVMFAVADEFSRPVSAGPAVQFWYPDGQLESREYWEAGKLVKPAQGFAIERWHNDGTIAWQENPK